MGEEKKDSARGMTGEGKRRRDAGTCLSSLPIVHSELTFYLVAMFLS